MQIFCIIGRLHVGMPHSKADPVDHEQEGHAEDEDSDVGMTDWVSCSGGSSFLSMYGYIYIYT